MYTTPDTSGDEMFKCQNAGLLLSNGVCLVTNTCPVGALCSLSGTVLSCPYGSIL